MMSNKIHLLHILFIYFQEAGDLGGPRKEFFRLMLKSIKEVYFEDGLNVVNKEHYEVIGVIFGMILHT